MMSRAKGAVLGMAWGEARGGVGRGTSLSLALVGAALERPPWALGNWVCWLLVGQRFGAWQGGDRYLNEALMRLRRGEPPERTGFPTPGIGPAARIGPLGVLLRGDPPSLVRACMESSLVTHADLRAAAFAFAVAYAVARLVDGDDAVDVAALLPDAVRGVEAAWTLPRQPIWERDQGSPHAVSEAIRAIFHAFPPNARLELDTDALRARIVAQARSHLPSGAATCTNSPFVLLGGMHALSLGLLSPQSPSTVLDEISSFGGVDAPAACAIAGAVLGSRYGASWVGSVPDRVGKWAEAIACGQRLEDLHAFCAAT